VTERPARIRAGGCLLGIALALLSLASCMTNEVHEARGVLVDVQSREIQNADSVTLRGGDGSVRSFRVSPEVASNADHPNSASHLRQHMMLGDPVVIRYRQTADGLVAVRILDASPS